jgi:hypothetical protein
MCRAETNGGVAPSSFEGRSKQRPYGRAELPNGTISPSMCAGHSMLCPYERSRDVAEWLGFLVTQDLFSRCLGGDELNGG